MLQNGQKTNNKHFLCTLKLYFVFFIIPIHCICPVQETGWLPRCLRAGGRTLPGGSCRFAVVCSGKNVGRPRRRRQTSCSCSRPVSLPPVSVTLTSKPSSERREVKKDMFENGIRVKPQAKVTAPKRGRKRKGRQEDSGPTSTVSHP